MDPSSLSFGERSSAKYQYTNGPSDPNEIMYRSTNGHSDPCADEYHSTNGHSDACSMEYHSTSSAPSSLESISERSLAIPHSWLLSDVILYPSQILGRGSYGTVSRGEWLGTPVAVKRLHKVFFEGSVSQTERRGVLRAFARELNILFQLKHPNIVSFYGVYDDGDDLTLSLGPDTCLVQQLLCCSLSGRNRQEPHLTFRQVLDLSLGITSGLRYLHERPEPIVHRDLAAKNILLSQSGVPKISDLGVAKVITSAQRFSQHSRQPGTDVYMPPEVKIEGVAYNCSVDVYSLGVIVMEVCIGRDPTATEAFRISAANGIGLQIVPEQERRRRDLTDLGDCSLKPLVLSCLAGKEDRPTAKRVYRELKLAQGSREYTSLPDVPIISAKVDHRKSDIAHLEKQVRVLQQEKGRLKEEVEYYTGVNGCQDYMEQRLIVGRGDPCSHPIDRTRLPEDFKKLSLRSSHSTKQSEASLFSTSSSSMSNQSARYLSRGSQGNLSSSSPAALFRRDRREAEESELKQLHRQLERYKNLSVELDLKLKDAKAELSKYSSRQTSNDLQSRYELQALQAENKMLRSQLDRSVRENLHLQQESAIHRHRIY